MALPYADPHNPGGVLRRAYSGFLRTSLGRWIAINVAAPIDPWLLRRTQGRLGMGLMLPNALLETTGAKSGAPRACSVLYFNDGADVVLVASSFGRDAHPAWYHNLVAHPDCVLGGDRFRAAEVEDEAERTRLWALADRVYGGYADYRERTAAVGRTIPLLKLSPDRG